MKNRKIKAISVIATILIYELLSPIIGILNWEKKYLYNEEQVELNWNVETLYEKEASIYPIKSKVSYYKKWWKISLNWNKNTFAIKIAKDLQNEYDKKAYIIVDWKKIELLKDSEWDDRTLLDEFEFYGPIFVTWTKEISYEITSSVKIWLEKKMELIWIDTESYTENITFSPEKTDASDSNIISRSAWWADETLTYEDNPKWVAILKQVEENNKKPKTEWQISQEQRIKDIRNYLAVNFPLEDNPVSTITEDYWHKLVWPIEKTKRVEKIFIHHTAEAMENNSKDEDEIMRWMYYYHAMTRWWWDIWYNYVVWKSWKIYEWRKWWDYAVAAHNLWNNKSTVWISVMWNFENEQIPDVQKKWIEAAIEKMSKKYWIDVNKTSISHKECKNDDTCLLTDYQTPNLSWHKDAWYTSCPWKNLYTFMWEFKEEWKAYSAWLSYLENSKIWENPKTLPKWPNIRIKISYDKNDISIKSYTSEKMKIEVWNKKWKIKLNTLNFEARWNDKIAIIVWKKSAKLDKIKISSTVLEIASMDRKPSWDTSWKINDNKFRWSLEIYNDNWKLTVINELPLEDYMKWIAEISNDENEQKAKTILVAARSYALWYTSKDNRKFPWKPYDWSDNPDEFQKYVWYSFELRSLNIWKYVDDTNSEVIEYDWKLIKPWYFNQSNWKTRSYTEYCEKRKSEWSFPKEQKCEDIPYLQSVYDPGWIIWWDFKWHWVWISWWWAKYFAEMEWKKYDEIIKYFLKWVTVEKIKY